MGYPKDLSRQASSKFNDVSLAIDWIEKQEKEASGSEDEYSYSSFSSLSRSSEPDPEDNDEDDSSSLDLSPDEERELHEYEIRDKLFNVKTIGDSPPYVPGNMTDEQLRRYMKEIKKRRLEEYRIREKEEEKARRKVQEEYKEKEEMDGNRIRKFLREKEKKERLEQKEKRKRLIESFESQKEIRRNNNGRLSDYNPIALPSSPKKSSGIKSSSSSSSQKDRSSIDDSTCTIKVRQTDGKVMNPFTLPSDATMSDVYKYIDSHRMDVKRSYVLRGALGKVFLKSTPGTLKDLKLLPGISFIMGPP